MNDQQLLTADELAAIRERVAQVYIKEPSEVRAAQASLRDNKSLLAHIEALEIEHGLALAQAYNLPGSIAIDALYAINGIVASAIGEWQMIETESTIANVQALAAAYQRLLNETQASRAADWTGD